MTTFETPTAFALDRQVDAWLASLRAQGYSSRQLEYRAGVLGRWSGGYVPSAGRGARRVIAAFQTWRDHDQSPPPP